MLTVAVFSYSLSFVGRVAYVFFLFFCAHEHSITGSTLKHRLNTCDSNTLWIPLDLILATRWFNSSKIRKNILVLYVSTRWQHPVSSNNISSGTLPLYVYWPLHAFLHDLPYNARVTYLCLIDVLQRDTSVQTSCQVAAMAMERIQCAL